MKEIVSQINSLKRIVKDALFSCRCKSTIVRGPNREIWRNWTYTYSKVAKEEFAEKMCKALRNTTFQPPLKGK